MTGAAPPSTRSAINEGAAPLALVFVALRAVPRHCARVAEALSARRAAANEGRIGYATQGATPRGSSWPILDRTMQGRLVGLVREEYG